MGDTDVKSLTTVDAVQSRLQGEAGTTVTVTWLDSAASSHTADLTHSGYTLSLIHILIYQMKDAINRVVGVVDETGAVISCSELNLIGEVRDGFVAERLTAGDRCLLYTSQ